MCSRRQYPAEEDVIEAQIKDRRDRADEVLGGYQQGREDGREERRLVAIRMLEAGMSMDVIQLATEYSPEEISKLQGQLSKSTQHP